MTQRLGRIVKIIVMLQAGVRCNALRIAAEAGVHRRTVFRDFAALRSLGFPGVV
jgi:predicted DNA-binding transcriptional regulator YafY